VQQLRRLVDAATLVDRYQRFDLMESQGVGSRIAKAHSKARCSPVASPRALGHRAADIKSAQLRTAWLVPSKNIKLTSTLRVKSRPPNNIVEIFN
jgi:hypothetical protein